MFADLSRRAGFHVEWEAIDKDEFLDTLTRELLQPDKSIMDALVLTFTREGALSVDKTARRFQVNFKRDQNVRLRRPTTGVTLCEIALIYSGLGVGGQQQSQSMGLPYSDEANRAWAHSYGLDVT